VALAGDDAVDNESNKLLADTDGDASQQAVTMETVAGEDKVANVDGEQQQQQQHDESESAGDGTSGVRAGQDDDCDADINQCSEVQHDEPQPAATENAQPLEQDGGETLQRHSPDDRGELTESKADCNHHSPTAGILISDGESRDIRLLWHHTQSNNILIIISFPSPTLSFIPDLKLSFSANPTAAFLFLLQD